MVHDETTKTATLLAVAQGQDRPAEFNEDIPYEPDASCE
jgi:hypothetical protein